MMGAYGLAGLRLWKPTGTVENCDNNWRYSINSVYNRKAEFTFNSLVPTGFI